MRLRLRTLASIALLAVPMVANADLITIDFDKLDNNFEVGSTYSGLGVTFINARTSDLRDLAGGSFPMGIVSYYGYFNYSGFYNPQPSHPISVVFSTPVSSVSLTGLDVGENEFVMTAYDSTVGGSIVDTDAVFGSGTGAGQFFILALTGTNIFRVDFSQVQYLSPLHEGAGWDNLVFETVDVPEPAAVALFGFGLAGLGLTRRRKPNTHREDAQ